MRGRLFLPGKRRRRQRRQLNALGGLIYLRDCPSGTKYLVDTGAAISVLPHSTGEPSSGPPIVGADGKPIPSYGFVTKSLTFGTRVFSCRFLRTAVASPILGLDFLAANSLLVDPPSRLVLDAATLQPIAGRAEFPRHRRSPLAAALCSISPEVPSLLAAFPTIIGDSSTPPAPLDGV